jgi:hypothetical protein
VIVLVLYLQVVAVDAGADGVGCRKSNASCRLTRSPLE